MCIYHVLDNRPANGCKPKVLHIVKMIEFEIIQTWSAQLEIYNENSIID